MSSLMTAPILSRTLTFGFLELSLLFGTFPILLMMLGSGLFWRLVLRYLDTALNTRPLSSIAVYAWTYPSWQENTNHRMADAEPNPSELSLYNDIVFSNVLELNRATTCSPSP